MIDQGPNASLPLLRHSLLHFPLTGRTRAASPEETASPDGALRGLFYAVIFEIVLVSAAVLAIAGGWHLWHLLR